MGRIRIIYSNLLLWNVVTIYTTREVDYSAHFCLFCFALYPHLHTYIATPTIYIHKREQNENTGKW
jgi:hypothetical protein